MKKAFIAFALFFLGFESASFAQIPGNSSTGLPRSRYLVKRYQTLMQEHPSSFMVKAKTAQGDGLGDYLLNTISTLQNAYLHVYFGVNAENKKCLVIAGTVLTQDAHGKAILTHDKDNVAGSGYLWMTTLNEPDCCLPYDYSIDYRDGQHNEPNCDLGRCTAGKISERTAQAYIANFQQGNGNIFDPVRPVIFVTESFLINANDIRKYLKKDMANGENIAYLQFYLGYKRQRTLENTALLMVGVDAQGKHVWDADDDGFLSMFDEGMPCPKCYIVNDEAIDYHHQDASQMTSTQ